MSYIRVLTLATLIGAATGIIQANAKISPINQTKTNQASVNIGSIDDSVLGAEEDIFKADIPLDRQFQQRHAGDCQTVAALKYLAVHHTDRLKNMISRNGNGFIVTFPETDLSKVNRWNANFDYSLNTVNVTLEDIAAFRSFYGRLGSLGQDVIYSALIKRMWDLNKYPWGVVDGKVAVSKDKRNFSSVQEFVDHLHGLNTMFLGTPDGAMFILTGDAYQNEYSDQLRELFLRPNSRLNAAEIQEKEIYKSRIRRWLQEGKIALVGQGSQYFSDSGPISYSDFKRVGYKKKKFDINEDGIVDRHTYAVLYDGRTDMVTLLNPWNFYEPSLGYDRINDGRFSMDLDAFLRCFTSFTVKKPIFEVLLAKKP